MASTTGFNQCPEEDGNPAEINVFYRRKSIRKSVSELPRVDEEGVRKQSTDGQRNSWMYRFLSRRGRKSIAISEDYAAQLRREEPNKKPKQAARKKKNIPLPPPKDYMKERAAYFQEVDAFDLLEESPSPKNSGRWVQNDEFKQINLEDLKSTLHPALRKWIFSKRCIYGAASLAEILEASQESNTQDEAASISKGSITTLNLSLSSKLDLDTSTAAFSSKSSLSNEKSVAMHSCSTKKNDSFSSTGNSMACQDDKINATKKNSLTVDLETAIGQLSLSPDSTLSDVEHSSDLQKLLKLCGQSSPSKLSEVFEKNGDISGIKKIGEGTYGEAFKCNENVFKVVPIDGNFLVNGEKQKESSELFEEVQLSLALNNLRHKSDGCCINYCKNFIETKGIQVCQGAYGTFLIKAWEEWDAKHSSENDNPSSFPDPDQQLYVVFILEDGGKDLESFVLSNHEEACSLLVQVTAALAVAEAACEFEHRDLHWGNVLLSRNAPEVAEIIIEGRKLSFKTSGLAVAIIDFTLSRIMNGNTILFMDLSGDPGLFDGPKNDIQSQVYRKMLEVTEGCWEGSFPKTNVLWLQYLVDILLSKKNFQRGANHTRELRSLKKRLLSYDSAQHALTDVFFTPLWVEPSP